MGRTHFSQMMSKPSLNQVCNEHIPSSVYMRVFVYAAKGGTFSSAVA